MGDENLSELEPEGDNTMRNKSVRPSDGTDSVSDTPSGFKVGDENLRRLAELRKAADAR